MPVWNGERYLADAISSILDQTFADFEFIILDDGSTDGTVGIVRSFADPRIRLVQLKHGGIVTALNRGIAESRAEWIARMDCDDIAKPKRLAAQWEAVRRRQDAVVCHTAIETMGDSARVTPRQQHLPRTHAMLAIRMCLHCPICHPTVLMRKRAVLRASGYVEEERHGEDYGLWSRLLSEGSYVALAQPLLRFRLHAESISQRKLAVQAAVAQKVSLETIRRLFPANPERAGWLLHRLGGTMPGLTPTESAEAIGMLGKARLLNWETLAWILVSSARRMGSGPDK